MRGLGAGQAVRATGLGPGPAHANGGGNTRLGWLDHVDTLDPHFTGFLGAVKVHNNIYNGLLKVEYDGKRVAFVPDLAEKWDVIDDKIHVFKLRPSVKFHDGTVCDDEAVKWSVERVWKGMPKSPHAWKYKELASVEVLDPLTVRMTFNKPYAFLPVALTGSTGRAGTIVSKAAVEKYGDKFGRNPVGTGPFVLKSWTAGDRLVVERNPSYWDKGRPYLDRVVLRPLPDAQSRFASLKSGETDVVWADESEADNIMRARKDSTLQVLTYAGSGAAVNAINTKVAPLDDVRVRRALVMALDRKKMSQALTNGLARPATNPYGDGSWVKCKDDGALPEDPKKAAALIKEYGKPVAFKMLFTATPGSRAAAQVYQQLWKQVGAEMEIEMVDQATFPPRAFQRKFVVIGWRIVDFPDPDVQMYANFHTGSPVALANYSNPELDKLLEHARVTPDEAKRTDDYCAISRIINQEAIWFWTFQNTYYAMAKAKVKGVPKLYGGVIDVSSAWLD